MDLLVAKEDHCLSRLAGERTNQSLDSILQSTRRIRRLEPEKELKLRQRKTITPQQTTNRP